MIEILLWGVALFVVWSLIDAPTSVDMSDMDDDE